MSITSRVALYIAVALVACLYMVSAAPIAIVNNGIQLEAGSSARINVFKKVNDEETVYTTTTTSTSTATSTKTTATEDATTTSTSTSTRTRTRTKATTTEEPTVTEEATTTTSIKAAKTTTTTESEAPTQTSTSKSKAAGSGSFSGDATWYNTGLGSCGWTNQESELIVAVNHGQMENGANSNNNPNCGRSISVQGPKGSVTVKVVDTCPGCDFGALDLSPAAFAKIADLSQGRVSVSWSWN